MTDSDPKLGPRLQGLRLAAAANILNNLRMSPGGFLAALANTATAAGIFFAVIQYNNQVEAGRTERTMDYISKWEDGNYLARYEALQAKIFGILKKRTPEEIQFLKVSPNETRRLAEENMGRRALDMMGTDGPKDVEQLFYFFNKISICVNYSLCSKKATNVYFRDTISSFWLYFKWYALEKQRAGYTQYGNEIENYLKSTQQTNLATP